jgi:hypothetical protein
MIELKGRSGVSGAAFSLARRALDPSGARQ